MKRERFREILLMFVIGILSSVTAYYATQLVGYLADVKMTRETLLISSGVAFLVALLFWYQRYTDRSTKMRIDLLLRMSYQGPFVMEMARNDKERMNYEQSISRKIYSLGKYYRRFGDINFCSYYIGCLAFYANANRGNVSWGTFKEALLSNFLDEILEGRIEKHVIDEHYQDKWGDLVDEAKKRRLGSG